MKKKSKKGFEFGKILYAIGVVLGVVALCMLFVDAVKLADVKTSLGTVKLDGSFSGASVAFGYAYEGTAVLKFSFLGFLPFLLTIGGVVLTLVRMFAKKSTKILDYVAIAVFVVAGVLFFIMPSFMVFADNLVAKIVSAPEYTLAVGSIIAGICSLLAGAVVLTKNLFKK